MLRPLSKSSPAPLPLIPEQAANTTTTGVDTGALNANATIPAAGNVTTDTPLPTDIPAGDVPPVVTPGATTPPAAATLPTDYTPLFTPPEVVPEAPPPVAVPSVTPADATPADATPAAATPAVATPAVTTPAADPVPAAEPQPAAVPEAAPQTTPATETTQPAAALGSPPPVIKADQPNGAQLQRLPMQLVGALVGASLLVLML